jgi:CDP-glycerol glycerophosphotransferase
MALVSVIIPVYDAGRYVDSCLESVRRQTHRDLQVVCIDDGSNDQSAAVLEQHGEVDARLQTIRQPNAGPGAARNVGLARAVGDFLMFVDADDVIPPDAVDRHLDALRSSTSDFSTGRVVRVAGAYRWPSVMHDTGLTRPAPATHVFRDKGLLFDTTSWNKLFRRDYWMSHQYAFPEGVMFEDVALMTEAHCRATSVSVVDDIVYWWRRRDDGTPSITMRRDDPVLLRDRVGSMRSVRRLLAELAPAAVRQAAEVKFLRHDLGSYFRELEETPTAFLRDFVSIVGGFVDGSPDSAVDQLPAHLRVGYQLVRRGHPAELAEYLAFLREHEGRLPVRRRGLSFRVDVGPVARVIPSKLSRAARRLPMMMSIDRLSWGAETLVIEGHGFIDGVPFGHPAAALRRIRLVDSGHGRERQVWVAPRRLPPMGRVQMTPSYEWSGFRAEISLALLEPRPGQDAARWQVNLQVLAMGAASGSALGPPLPGSGFDELKRTASGMIVRVHWADGKRLVIETAKVSCALVHATAEDGMMSLSLRISHERAPGPHALRLVSSTDGTALDVPIHPTRSATADDLVHVLLDPSDLLTEHAAPRPRVFRLALTTAAGDVDVTSELTNECTLTHEDGAVTVAEDDRGRAEVILARARSAISGLSWRGDQLLIQGSSSAVEDGLAGLAWSNGGDMIPATLRRCGGGLRASFDLAEIAGPDLLHPVAAGEWTLMQALEDGSYRPAVTSGSSALTSTRTLTGGAATIRTGLDSRRALIMSVSVLPPSERSALGQQRLQSGVYRRSRRSPLADVILVESWGGKKFSDNPRALAAVASSDGSAAVVVVVVADRAVPLPRGMSAVLAGSRDHYEQRARARMIISNDCLPTHFIKRPGQKYLQTWHGTPLKRIGLDIERVRFRTANYRDDLRAESRKWDWLISQNAYSSEIFRSAFAYDGPIIESGYPRNDLLARADERTRTCRRDHVRRWLDIHPDQTVVLWAPTWRDDLYTPGGVYGASMVVDPGVLDAQLPDGIVVLFHGHHLLGSVSQYLGRRGRVRNVTGYPEVEDLILASDALVTDYSSIMFDYALTGRPIIYFVPDLLHYERTRGLYLELPSVAGGPVVSTVGGLTEVLRNLSVVGSEFEHARTVLRERFCSLDDGTAAARAWAAVNS